MRDYVACIERFADSGTVGVILAIITEVLDAVTVFIVTRAVGIMLMVVRGVIVAVIGGTMTIRAAAAAVAGLMVGVVPTIVLSVAIGGLSYGGNSSN